MNFVWDKEKSEINLQKHHVSFDLAARVFLDENRVEIYDEKHSVDEDRYIVIGYVENVPLFVVYSMADDDGNEDCYRIISARKALKSEVERCYTLIACQFLELEK